MLSSSAAYQRHLPHCELSEHFSNVQDTAVHSVRLVKQISILYSGIVQKSKRSELQHCKQFEVSQDRRQELNLIKFCY